MNIQTCEDRLKAMVILDKQEIPQNINKVIKSEILYVLKNYFEISSEDLIVDLYLNESGKYELNLKLESRFIKRARTF